MDEGRFPLENAARYFYSDGSYYTTAYGEWALSMISDNVVNDQYREITFQASCYFPKSSNPGLSGQHTVGCTSDLYDYYTGEWLPMTSVYGESSAEENTYSYTLNIDGLVFCASPSPYTYEELTAHLHEGEGYVTGMTLDQRTGIDEDNALFCRIW